MSMPQPVTRRGPPPPIRFRHWPFAAGGWTTLELIVPLTLVLVAVGGVTRSAGLTVMAAGFLTVAMWKFFVPTEYEINLQGVSEEVLGRRRRIPWSLVDSYSPAPLGVVLDVRRSPGRSRKKIYVPFADHRDDMLAALAHYLRTERGRDSELAFELRA